MFLFAIIQCVKISLLLTGGKKWLIRSQKTASLAELALKSARQNPSLRETESMSSMLILASTVELVPVFAR